MNGGALWLTFIVAGMAVVAGFGYLSKRRLTSGRELIDIATSHARVSDQVSLEVLGDVMNAIAQAYGVDPRALRPEDLLETLYRADSWFLDAGTEKLNQWLFSNGFSDQSIPAKTILELARLVEDRRRTS